MKDLKKLFVFMKMAWKVSPSYIVLLILNSLIGGGQILANVLIPRYLIDELSGPCDVGRLVFYTMVLVGVNAVFALLNNTMKRFLGVKNLYVRDRISSLMGEKVMSVDYRHLEDPYYLDLKERASFAINSQNVIESVIINLADVVKQFTTLLGVVVIMFSLSWILVVLLCVGTGILIIIYALFSKYQVKFFQQIIPVNRKYSYYIGLAYDEKIQKDVRLYSMSDMMEERVTQYNREINTWFMGFFKKEGKFMGLFTIVNDLEAALANGYVAIRVITDKWGARISIGGFTMYVSAAVTFSKTIFGFAKGFVTLIQYLTYLDPFMEFMELPDDKCIYGNAKLEGGINSIRFENVTFAYPKCEKPVLNNLSFEIKGGEKVSIVGLNGAGKSTVVKLLCRLYKPMEGNIYINDKNIYEYESQSYNSMLAAVFQDYMLFAFSIEENITCRPCGEDADSANELIKKVGLSDKIKELPEGLKTYFGKSYDENGIEMSGGQAQKVAIARALYKNASLIILDEPTSALDPIAEAEIYENFNSLVGGKTAIYISHRMSSSVFCDKILVIDGGTVKDYDTHENLMKKTDSLYYKLFHSQALNYEY